MAYSRTIQPATLPRGEELAGDLVGLGIRLAGRGAREPIIEDTLLAASIEGMEHDDLRVLALLTSWLEVHHPWVNADRLVRIASSAGPRRARTYWAAVGRWLSTDRRFARLQGLHREGRTDLLRRGTRFQVGRRGEDPRFEGTPLRVPAGVLRNRPSDILTPCELAERHRTYRQRVHIGPSYRADMWALLEAEPRLASAELARRTYGSYATAWRVKRDFGVLAERGMPRP